MTDDRNENDDATETGSKRDRTDRAAGEPPTARDDREGGTMPGQIALGIDLETIDVPGDGDTASQRREAVGAVLEYLREHGTATPADLREEVYPDHPAQYTDGEDSARSWWKDCVSPALRRLAERDDRLESVDATDAWSWTDDED